ncbi:hypothetical protein KXD93_11935 [Mucilaginibacter sp. BJC16-A38]|uniref:hypothetical protein n=1 Tax=Mucilaginibacter phenanthrenivorans TaxID=1234842 RepID=UPI002157FB14|nr:hypothetical protein [Mucilaginibacter phenanthrenivorans]MCR8558359.1 hypothetical protein [Mucilaginibacter phenanthrenivorans]
MKTFYGIFFILTLLSCNNKPKSAVKKDVRKKVEKKSPPAEKAIVKYTDKQLEAFLDSVGHLAQKTLADKVAFGVDSIFKNFTKPMNRLVPANDFEQLKKAIKAKMITPRLARTIFGELSGDSTCNANGLLDSVKKGYVHLSYFPFDKLRQFAVRVSDAEHCNGSDLYFFRDNRIIAKQDGYSKYFDDDIKYYPAGDGNTIVYRMIEFNSGSGIWWNQYFFYKYDGDQLIPVLNIPENTNLLQPSPWGLRELWFESTVKRTIPLTIKMVYHQTLPDTTEPGDFDSVSYNNRPMIVNDSTVVKYSWNKQTKTLQPDFTGTKINQAQILSYYLNDNELLAINAYYTKYQKMMISKKKRPYLLNYLNTIKNYK